MRLNSVAVVLVTYPGPPTRRCTSFRAGRLPRSRRGWVEFSCLQCCYVHTVRRSCLPFHPTETTNVSGVSAGFFFRTFDIKLVSIFRTADVEGGCDGHGGEEVWEDWRTMGVRVSWKSLRKAKPKNNLPSGMTSPFVKI